VEAAEGWVKAAASPDEQSNRSPDERTDIRDVFRCAHAGYGPLQILENGMNRKVEIERMQAAFKRAAEKATRGTRGERSGRFEIRDDLRLTQGDTQTVEPMRGSNNLKK
jgi:hypothetical protein